MQTKPGAEGFDILGFMEDISEEFPCDCGAILSQCFQYCGECGNTNRHFNAEAVALLNVSTRSNQDCYCRTTTPTTQFCTRCGKKAQKTMAAGCLAS